MPSEPIASDACDGATAPFPPVRDQCDGCIALRREIKERDKLLGIKADTNAKIFAMNGTIEWYRSRSLGAPTAPAPAPREET
jgi:hypothetical protein